MIFSLPVSAMKKKNLQIVTLLILSIMLILSWNLELEDCFWLINIVQLVYILAFVSVGAAKASVKYSMYNSKFPAQSQKGTFTITCTDEGKISDNG